MLLRRLGKTPGFTVITLLTLAIGIGANTAIFSVINGILIKPLPYPDSDRLVSITIDAPGVNIKGMSAAPSTYFIVREESQTLEHMGLWTADRMNVKGSTEPEQVEGINITPSLLHALQVTPLAGRLFTDQDAEPKGPKTAMLTFPYVSRRYGGNAGAAVGRQIRIDSEAYEIIGVLPRSFRFMDREPMILTALRFDRAKIHAASFSYNGIARLKTGVTLAQAKADTARLLATVADKFPLPPGFARKMWDEARIAPDIHSLKQEMTGDLSTMLWVLMATIGIVLFIACANVANLLLVRAECRQQELAIRAALGASRWDAARDLLTESLALSLAGGGLGLAVAKAALVLLARIAPAGLPRLGEIGLDPLVFVFAFGVSVLAGLSFGLVPVWKYAGPSTGSVIRDGGRTSSAGRERHRARSALVVVQVALALVLLTGAGLMIRTFIALTGVDPGFRNPGKVLTVTVGYPDGQIKSNDRVLTVFQETLRRLAAIPGVESAALASSVPMDGNSNSDPVWAEDRAYRDGEIPPVRRFKHVSPGLFSTLGNPLVAGRDFDWNDLTVRAPVVIVSDGLARELWNDPAKAIGKRIRESPKSMWREVIGVVGDERDEGLMKPALKTVYWPLAHKGVWGEGDSVRRYVRVAIRGPRVGTEAFLQEVRNAIWSVEPSTPVASVSTMQQFLDRSLSRTSFTLVMLSIAGAMALLLGVIGIYGVVSYSVSQRTREIGIRTALGASAGTVRGMFVRHALVLCLIGSALGTAASMALTRWISSLLYGVSPYDWVTLTAAPLVLMAAAWLGSYLPARRAGNIAPVEALRL